MHADEFLRTKMSRDRVRRRWKDRWQSLQKRARQSMNRPTIIELSSEANASARRMWNKLTIGGPLNEIHPSLVMKKKRKEKKQTRPRRACTVILISYAVRVFPLFPRNTAMPAIILTRTRVRYSAVARWCIWIPWILASTPKIATNRVGCVISRPD